MITSISRGINITNISVILIKILFKTVDNSDLKKICKKHFFTITFYKYALKVSFPKIKVIRKKIKNFKLIVLDKICLVRGWC